VKVYKRFIILRRTKAELYIHLQSILDIRDLVVEYELPGRTVSAVRSLNLKVPKGEVLAVVGESGSGKSTLGLAILGLVKKPGVIKHGSVFYNETDLLKLRGEELRTVRGKQIAAIPQDPMTSLNPVRTIESHFREFAKAHGSEMSEKEIDERALTVFDYVNLPPNALKSYPHELSGGMRQRVMIALALFFGPNIILADEPTTALDVVTESQILDILAKLQREAGLTMLIFTHNFGIVSRLANRVAVMYAGSLVELGGIDDLFNNAAHPYTKALIDSIPKLTSSRKDLVYIPGFPPNLSRLPSGCTFHPRCPYATEICARESPCITSDGERRMYACHNPILSTVREESKSTRAPARV
jgi:oligopeptide/dipeptide ABC transporter ATP-binding protein